MLVSEEDEVEEVDESAFEKLMASAMRSRSVLLGFLKYLQVGPLPELT